MNENLQLSEEARQARNRYARAWRAKNKDSVRASNARYWEKRAAREAESRVRPDVGAHQDD